jgi:predicted enzyme related to lactoylglutathione lyase
VFGWTFTPGRVDDGWGVTGTSPMMGMHGGADRPAVVPMFGVRDVAAAVAAVRAAGGTSTEPELMPYGTTANCVDDQGVSFYLGQV